MPLSNKLKVFAAEMLKVAVSVMLFLYAGGNWAV
jgi:hypothetical protein